MSFEHHSVVSLKDENWITKQRLAGACVAECLSLAEDMVLNGGVSGKDIEAACVQVMKNHDCTATFLNYKNSFPASICLSINKQMVHGIPTDEKIKDTDVVKVDLGATYQEAIADSAITVCKSPGIHKEMINACQESLYNGIQQISLNKRLGSIGSGIAYVAKKYKYGLITNYGGHGLDWNKPHSEPFVANKDQSKNGIRFQSGMTLAIEPMLTMSNTKTRVLSDGWTVVTDSISAHWEHTIFVHADRIELMTHRIKEKVAREIKFS